MKIAPKEINFGEAEKVSLKVTASDDMIYKVLTTLPSAMTSNPSIGVLPGGRSVDIAISFRKAGYEAREKGQELRLKVLTRKLTREEFMSYSVHPKQTEYIKQLLSSSGAPTESTRIPVTVAKASRLPALPSLLTVLAMFLFYVVGVFTSFLWQPMFTAIPTIDSSEI